MFFVMALYKTHVLTLWQSVALIYFFINVFYEAPVISLWHVDYFFHSDILCTHVHSHCYPIFRGYMFF